MKQVLVQFLLIITLNAAAVIINVPTDYSTIQEGINAAALNDTVMVAPGIYYENIVWPAVNGIKLTGSGVFDCLIDGDELGSVITFDAGSSMLDSTTVLSGFTLRNGNAFMGGGINAHFAAPKLIDLIIAENLAEMDGGGLFSFNYSHIKLQNVTISDNTAGSEGGGINCDFTSNIKLFNCIILNNTADFGGGGLCIEGGSHPEIHNTLFAGNYAEYGGGIWSGEKGSGELINCTVVNNSASLQGGGYFSYYPTMTVVNSIFWDNTPEQIWEDAYVYYSDIQEGWTGLGNIDADPLFVEPENGNYLLTEDSPCIDAGDPNLPNDPDGTTADMGAYYYDQTSEADNEVLPELIIALSNFPNPFNPITTISFQLSEVSKVSLSIFNIKGQLINTLLEDIVQSGTHSVIWTGKGDDNNPVCTGIYFSKLVAGNQILTKRMVLLK